MIYQYTCPRCKKFFRSNTRMEWVTCICCGANWYVSRQGGRTRACDFQRYSALGDTYSLLLRILVSALIAGGILYVGISKKSLGYIILAFSTFECAMCCSFRI